MKRIAFRSSMLGLVLCGLVACSNSNEVDKPNTTHEKPATTDSQQVAETYTERYVVGVDTSYPPFTFRDSVGTPAGFEIEILQAIAKDQKFGLDLVSAERDSLYPSLEEGHYQILAASLKSSPERLQKSEFTDGFAQSHHAILSRKDKVAKSGKELAGLGVTAVQEATNSQKRLEELGAEMSLHPSVFAAFKAFMAGEADHVTGDSVALGYHLKEHAGSQITDYVMSPFDDAGNKEIAFAVQKGNSELLDKMNAGLVNIKANGTYDQIYNKYFSDQNASVNQK